MRRSHSNRLVQSVVSWYLRTYHETQFDLGVPAMFCSRSRVGRFAVPRAAFSAGTGRAIFNVIVAATIFQRRQDQQVFRILRRLSSSEVSDLTGAQRLYTEALASRCTFLRSRDALHNQCDIAKLPGGRATCQTHPRLSCPPKRHAVLLRRYADFGKVPSSAALVLREQGVRSFAEVYARLMTRSLSASARADVLEAEVMSVWRISRKIAAMVLSALSNPDLGAPRPPWTEGVEWQRWVVIDSNVDNFLTRVGCERSRSYEERADRVRELSRAVRLDRFKRGLVPYNPRLVQQAIYMFMSSSNRMSSEIDCVRNAPVTCRACESTLRQACPVRPNASRTVRPGAGK